ncbi:MAG TPA: NADH-quinone oxidoreductase subunit L [Gaiellales bacterium]
MTSHGLLGATARLAVLLPTLAALAGLLLSRRRHSRAAAIAVVGAAATLVVTVLELAATHGGQARSSIGLAGHADTGLVVLGLTLRADRLSALVAVAVAVVALCVQLYSTAYLASDRRYPAYAAEVSLFTAAMLLVVQADDLVLLLVGWEVMGLCSYLLVGHDSERLAARRAAVKAFLVTRVGDVGFVLGIITIISATRTASISELLLPQTRQGLPGWVWPLALLFLVAGVAGKSAQFPLHTWLPDAMEGPTPISALIHAATMVAAGAYVVARLLPLFAMSTAARDVLAVIACISMLGAALAAFGQADLKRLLAYSTISQVAYLLAALAVTPATGAGAGPGIAHLLAHAGFKALLFLAAGIFTYVSSTTLLTGLGGSWRRTPLVAACFTLGLAALAGVPPLSGFWSKEAVLAAAESAATHGDVRVVAVLVLVVGIITSFVTAAYAMRAWLLVVPDRGAREPGAAAVSAARTAPGSEAVFVVEADRTDDVRVVVEDETDTDVTDVGPVPAVEPLAEHGLEGRVVPDAMRWPVLVLTVPTVLGGLLQLGSVIPGRLHLSLTTMVLTLVLVVAAGLLVVGMAAQAPLGDPLELLPTRVEGWLLGGFGLDRLQHRLVVRPVRALARVVVGGDVDVVDAYARSTAVATRWTGRWVSRVQSGVTTSYLTWLAAGVVLLGIAGVSLR